MANEPQGNYAAYLLGAAGMTNLQRMTRVATEGVAGNDGRFRSMEAGTYLRDLLADRLLGDDGKVMENVVIPKIVEQYSSEVLGQPVEHTGKGFSILDAFNKGTGFETPKKKTASDGAKKTSTRPTQDTRGVSRDPLSPMFEGGGFGGGDLPGGDDSSAGMPPGDPNSTGAQFAHALAATNPFTGLISAIAQATNSFSNTGGQSTDGEVGNIGTPGGIGGDTEGDII